MKIVQVRAVFTYIDDDGLTKTSTLLDLHDGEGPISLEREEAWPVDFIKDIRGKVVATKRGPVKSFKILVSQTLDPPPKEVPHQLPIAEVG